MKTGISFPARKIKILNADVEIDVEVSEAEYNQLMNVFNEHEMNPITRLTVIGPGGDRVEFTNLSLMKTEGLLV